MAFHALIPFSGALSPDLVRSRMAGPNLNGPPATIWRRTTIQHSNADGSFCLYACERTGEALWVPVGEYFVGDRPRGAQPAGTIMDHLFSHGSRAFRPEGYGIHHTGRIAGGENGNIRRPRSDHASTVGRPEIARATRPHRFNPLVRLEPAAAGTGSRRTVARRDRRDRARGLDKPPQPPPPGTISNSTTTSTVGGGNAQGHESGYVNGVHKESGDTTASQTPPLVIPTITIYNRNNRTNGDVTSPQLATLNLSDEEDT